MQDLFQELKAAGGWPALLNRTNGSRMQALLGRLLQHGEVRIRRTAQCLLLLQSAANCGVVSGAEAEAIARDLFDLGNGHRKQGLSGSCTAVPRTRR